MAASVPRRYRSATSTSIPPTTTNDILKALLDTLRNVSDPIHEAEFSRPPSPSFSPSAPASSSQPPAAHYAALPALSNVLLKIAAYISSRPAPNTLQSDFRHQNGFPLLLTVLKRFSGFYDPRIRSPADIAAFFSVLGAWLELLGASLARHSSNQRFFKTKVDGGGWAALEQILASLGVVSGDAMSAGEKSGVFTAEGQSQSQSQSHKRADGTQESKDTQSTTQMSIEQKAQTESQTSYRLFGKLLAFALGDKALDRLFEDVAVGNIPLAVDGDSTDDPASTDESSLAAKDRRTANDATMTTMTTMTTTTTITTNESTTKNTSTTTSPAHNQNSHIQAALTARVRKIVTPTTQFQHPEVLRVIIDFWKAIPRSQPATARPSSSSDDTEEQDLPLNLCSWLVLRVLVSVVSVSMFNLSGLHRTSALSDFLQICFGGGISSSTGSSCSISSSNTKALSSTERALLLNLCKMLMYLGIPSPSDTQFLLTCGAPDALSFCLEMASQYVGPAFFQFDLSLNGYSAVELPALGRPFPPPSAAGYTFTAWLRIDRFDPNTHTTIFGVFDVTQTCFLMLYLEKDTHNFILQTSVTSTRPSVRFKAVSFEERTWYHIALVHRRSRSIMSNSKASLYVNGEFVEQMRCGYPQPPPPTGNSPKSDSFAALGLAARATSSLTSPALGPVQAFLGTPRNLSGKSGAGLIMSKWSLASAHLLDDVLSDDFLAVHYGLGARYQGNFQDSLGGFQTYEASANLGLRNEMMHPGKDENSDILRAIRGKAAALLPENKTLLSFLPAAVYRDDVSFYESSLFQSLPRSAAASVLHVFRRGTPAVAVNAAVPFLAEAFTRPYGMAVLSGNPVVAVPSYLDDNMWRLAGFTPLALKLLHRAQTAQDMLRIVEMIFTCVRHSWRNSDAMERDNGYAIMGLLLRAKLGFGMPSAVERPPVRVPLTREERDSVCLRLLKLVLQFVGYNHGQPIESFIVNPLAYRILLIDVDTWRRSSTETQELYYLQFVTFAVKSKYHEFNSRRLVRMRIIKRLLEALKSEPLTEEVMPSLRLAFEALVKSNFSTDVQRALALFITYMFRASASNLASSSASSHSARINTNRNRSASSWSNPHGNPNPGSTNPNGNSSVSGFSTTGATTTTTANVRPSLGSRRPTIEVNSPNGASVKTSPPLARRQIGSRVLGWYSNLLCDTSNTATIHKFARTVTNRWLLYLLTEDDPEIVVYGAKILARVLVIHGTSYTAKFASKTGGFTIMAARLRRWWDIPTLWPICFSILFGFDVAAIDFERTFDFFSLMDIFHKPRIVHPDVLPVIMAMLQHGVKQVVSQQEEQLDEEGGRRDEGGREEETAATAAAAAAAAAESGPKPAGRRPRARSMELSQALGMRKDVDKIAMRIVVLQTITRFLADLHTTSSEFRDFALTSDYSRLLLAALYPVVVSTDAVNPEVELNSAGSALTFDGSDVIIKPLGNNHAGLPIVRRASPHSRREKERSRSKTESHSEIKAAADSVASSASIMKLRKASSFVLLTADAPLGIGNSAGVGEEATGGKRSKKAGPSSARLAPAFVSPVEFKGPGHGHGHGHGQRHGHGHGHLKNHSHERSRSQAQQTSNVVLQGLLELVIAVFCDQILSRKEFPGFNLACKIPPGFQEHQAYFESYVLRNTIQQLKTEIQLNLTAITEPRVLMNLARFNVHVVVDSIFAGWFIGGADSMLEFTGVCLEYLQQPAVASLKSVRLCSQAVATLRTTFFKMILLQLSELQDVVGPDSDSDSDSENSGSDPDSDIESDAESDAESETKTKTRAKARVDFETKARVDFEAAAREAEAEARAKAVMDNIMYWQAAILGSLAAEDEYMKLLWYQLYIKLIDRRKSIRVSAATIMRIMMVQRPEEAASLFQRSGLTASSSSSLGRTAPATASASASMSSSVPQAPAPDGSPAVHDFEVVTEMDNEAFLEWVDNHRSSLDALFFGQLAKAWEDFVATENVRTAENERTRLARRREKLRQWNTEAVAAETVLDRHTLSNNSWMKSIYYAEHTKHQRLMQDRTDDAIFLAQAYARMDRDLSRPGGLFAEPAATKWKLDRTEGRDRMRLRLLPDYSTTHGEYQPKRRYTETAGTVSPGPLSPAASCSVPAVRVNNNSGSATSSSLSIGRQRTRSRAASDARSVESLSVGYDGPVGGLGGIGITIGSGTEMFPDAGESDVGSANPESDALAGEDDFEMIDDPNDVAEGDDAFEDKNRKVMRRLQPDDAVQAVFNISRIIGLEAAEGILIVGKDALYMMDGVFHCASGEIVNAWQAPADERDPYSQIIMDPRAVSTAAAIARPSDQESRHWRWADVLSISKRRFLFRDVAVEVFFTDGRSYLLTAIDSGRRDELFTQLARKAPHSTGSAPAASDDAWRLESLRLADEGPSSGLGGFGGLGQRISGLGNLGSLGGLFGQQTPFHSVTRRWQRGEMSNFHYLMMVNTMAGRTFNDLTQYPVFPWVLADYTSSELNLNDPATFRDLSKPMGAQTPGRIPAYHENYTALAEIDETPFHYGTHYSTAMIVSSYLIRLPPFVHSFILLQGGSFDHADRLFHSIPAAWRSASADNKTDVRELIPEFFCLPEFLRNINGYAFGTRESTGTPVDHVELPPWAHGDPKVFIQKHREALECPYVSQHLHAWIDLIFGYKQRGEAAVESMNVFHWQSYEGASNLDDIEDLQEKRIAAGVIHNFGQTPKMVFARPHPVRENVRPLIRRVDAESSVYSLTRLAAPLLETGDRVASLVYVPRLDRLLAASPFRRHFAPYDKYLDFGFADASLRFFFADSRKPAGLCENLHAGALSAALLPDSKTLVTAGEDCVISVFALKTSHGRPVDVTLRKALFAHRRPVELLAASTAFSMLVSVSEGQVFVWDLNRLELVRRLSVPAGRRVEGVVVSEANGDIMLAAGGSVVLFNINGELILDQRVCGRVLNADDSATAAKDDVVHAVAFYDGAGSESLENQLVFTGHRHGRVTVWKRVVDSNTGRWALDALRRLEHSGENEKGASSSAAVTCITAMPGSVYTGDEEGRVWEWTVGGR
ncbi:hypothetical protein TD95_001437 [Thielaviopsis punctulata]|uniref:Beige protein homolog 1 n=1 Tax=Thielaviopsis punctulata TaxID=72032 RepID=A0A0F4ZBS6_9PEZI|nr:hypothetical protein TD95_001437 [Thielaviopsis punctulata]